MEHGDTGVLLLGLIDKKNAEDTYSLQIYRQVASFFHFVLYVVNYEVLWYMDCRSANNNITAKSYNSGKRQKYRYVIEV